MENKTLINFFNVYFNDFIYKNDYQLLGKITRQFMKDPRSIELLIRV